MIKIKYTATIFLETELLDKDVPAKIRELPEDKLIEAMNNEITTNLRSFLKEELSDEFYEIDLSSNTINVEKVSS